jgi:hypothetical protein
MFWFIPNPYPIPNKNHTYPNHIFTTYLYIHSYILSVSISISISIPSSHPIRSNPSYPSNSSFFPYHSIFITYQSLSFLYLCSMQRMLPFVLVVVMVVVVLSIQSMYGVDAQVGKVADRRNRYSHLSYISSAGVGQQVGGHTDVNYCRWMEEQDHNYYLQHQQLV